MRKIIVIAIPFAIASVFMAATYAAPAAACCCGYWNPVPEAVSAGPAAGGNYWCRWRPGNAAATETVAAGDTDGALYATKCAACHALPNRGIHSAAAWEEVLARHEKGGRATFAGGERTRLLAYLQAGAGK